MNLNSQGLDVVGSVRSACEIRQVKLNLVPSFIQPHRHRANEGLYASGGLVVGSSEPSAHVLIVKNLDLESEVFPQVLDDHYQERKLDAKRLLWVPRTCNKCCTHIRSHDFKN